MRSIAHKIWYIILIFIILLPGIGVAQSSFQKISPDKNGVDRLNAITEKYFNYSLSKSIESSSEAIALSNSIHYKKGLTKALINLGEINLFLGNRVKAICNISEARELALKTNDNDNLANCYRVLSLIDEGWNNSKEAITNQMSALNYQMKGQDEKGIIDSYLIIGAIQLNNAEYEIAFEYFEKALFHSIKILNPPLISRCFLMFAEEFIILGNQNAARKILEVSRQMDSICSTGLLSKYYLHLAEALYQEKLLNNIQKGIECNLLSIYPMNDSLNPINISKAYTRIAHLYSKSNQFEKSLTYDKKALRLRQDVGHLMLIGSSYTNLGLDYLQLNKVDSALIYLNKGLEIALKHGREKFIANTYEKLYLLYKKTGNIGLALHYFELYSDVNKNILNKSTKLDLEKSRSRLEIGKKEIELTKARLEKQQNLYIYLIIMILLGLIVFITIYLIRAHSEKKLKLLYEELEARYDNIINQLQGKIIEVKYNLNKLIISEEKFRVLFEENPIGICTLSVETFKILSANHAFCEMLEYTEEELCELSIADITHPDDLAQETAYKIPDSNELNYTLKIEKRYITKSKKVIWGSLTTSVVFGFNSQPIYALGIVQNITEKRISETNLIASEERLRLLIDSSPIVIAMLDMDMRYVIVNDAFYNEFNIDNDIIGKKVQEVFPNITPPIFEMYCRSINGESFSKIESDFSFIDGDEKWFNWTLSQWYQTPGNQSGIIQFAVNITQRIQYERQLNENLHLLNKIFQSIPSSIFVFDPSNYKILWATSNFYDSFGMTRKEYEILHFDNIISPIHPDDIQQINSGIQFLTQQADGTPYTFEFRKKDKNGEWHWFYSKAIVFKRKSNGDVEEILSSSLEITERKLTEAALQKSESKFREHIDQAADAIFSGNAHGYFINVNLQACILTGYTKEELIGMHISKLFTQEQLQLKPLNFDSVLLGNSVHNERTLHRKNGELVTVEMSTKMMSDGTLQAIFHNITELKATENKLRDKENKLREAQQIAKMGSWSYDFTNKTFDYSENLFTILNIPPPKEDFVFNQEYLFQSVHPEDLDELIEFNKDLLIEKKTNYIYEFRVITKTGKTCYLETVGQITYNGKGMPIKQVATIIDITDRKQTEIQIRKSFERERELNELKSNFVSMISHEFRNPLASISSSNELLNIYFEKLEDENPTKIKSQKQIQQINAEIKRLILLIENVLVINKEGAGKLNFSPENVRLESFIPLTLVEIQRNIIDERRTIFNLTGEPIEIRVDKTLFYYILNNLVSNAFKFSKGKRAPELNLIFTENLVKIEMTDYGIGIPNDEQKYLFDTFFRAKNAASIPGSGLGLVLIKHFVELHNGEIQIKSALEQGTTFTITLPIKENA